MNDLYIRLAREADVPALVALYAELHAFHVHALSDRLRTPNEAPSDDGLQGHLRHIIVRQDAAIFVAEVSSQIAGLAEVYR